MLIKLCVYMWYICKYIGVKCVKYPLKKCTAFVNVIENYGFWEVEHCYYPLYRKLKIWASARLFPLNASVADLIHMYRNINVWQRFPCITLLISRTQVHTCMYFWEMSVKAYLFVVVMCMHNAHVCRFWEFVAYTNIK